MKHSWDTAVKCALHWESVTDQTPVSCQDHLVPCQTSTDDRQVLLAAFQPRPVWLLI